MSWGLHSSSSQGSDSCIFGLLPLPLVLEEAVAAFSVLDDLVEVHLLLASSNSLQNVNEMEGSDDNVLLLELHLGLLLLGQLSCGHRLELLEGLFDLGLSQEVSQELWLGPE